MEKSKENMNADSRLKGLNNPVDFMVKTVVTKLHMLVMFLCLCDPLVQFDDGRDFQSNFNFKSPALLAMP